MSHEIVEDLIKKNEKRVRRISEKLQDSLAENVVRGITKEINDLKEWLPTFEVLCNPGLQDRHWNEIQDMVNADFSLKNLSFAEIKIYSI